MNPIPLTDPDGTVYAYACGLCFSMTIDATYTENEPAPEDLWSALGYWFIEPRAEISRQAAERCCLCPDCGVRMGPLKRGLCEPCTRKSEERWVQEMMAAAPQYGEAYFRGLVERHRRR